MRRIFALLVAGWFVTGFTARVSAQEEMSDDPLSDIATDMNAAATRLAKLKTDKPTQKSQNDAVKKLDLLIKELEERRGGMQGGNMVDPNARDPAQGSTIRQGPGGIGKLQAERQEGKQWGELPPKERERILQSMNEGFPSHYKKLLERYFVRLASEKAAGDAEDATGDAKPKVEKDAK